MIGKFRKKTSGSALKADQSVTEKSLSCLSDKSIRPRGASQNLWNKKKFNLEWRVVKLFIRSVTWACHSASCNLTCSALYGVVASVLSGPNRL